MPTSKIRLWMVLAVIGTIMAFVLLAEDFMRNRVDYHIPESTLPHDFDQLQKASDEHVEKVTELGDYGNEIMENLQKLQRQLGSMQDTMSVADLENQYNKLNNQQGLIDSLIKDYQYLKEVASNLLKRADKLEKDTPKCIIINNSTANWTSPYAITTSCSYRPHRINPFQQPEYYPCPVKYKFTANLSTVATKQGVAQYSTVTCTKEKHCKYSNVCFRKSQLFFYKAVSDTTFNKDNVMYNPYKSFKAPTAISWHYALNVQNGTRPPSMANFVNGTSLFWDQSYANLCHMGHTSEFFTKLVDVRKSFPGKIDKIIYGKDHEKELDASSKIAYKFCHHGCNTLRIPFEDSQYNFPVMLWMDRTQEFQDNEFICFENLIVPSVTHQHFTSKDSAERYRQAALKMCGIPPRKVANDPKKILFFERGHDRQIYNAEELCTSFRKRGYNTFLETDDLQDFCQQIATIHSADIIITVDGAHNNFLAYARPGTTVLFISPYNFRVPDWKTLAYWAGLRVVEFVSLNATDTMPHEGFSTDNMEKSLGKTMEQCVFDYWCRAPLRHHDTFVALNELIPFVDYALLKVDKINEASLEPCERPLKWPTPVKETPNLNQWSNVGYETNFQVCEPSYNARCGNNPDCKKVASMTRGF